MLYNKSALLNPSLTLIQRKKKIERRKQGKEKEREGEERRKQGKEKSKERSVTIIRMGMRSQSTYLYYF